MSGEKVLVVASVDYDDHACHLFDSKHIVSIKEWHGYYKSKRLDNKDAKESFIYHECVLAFRQMFDHYFESLRALGDELVLLIGSDRQKKSTDLFNNSKNFDNGLCYDNFQKLAEKKDFKFDDFSGHSIDNEGNPTGHAGYFDNTSIPSSSYDSRFLDPAKQNLITRQMIHAKRIALEGGYHRVVMAFSDDYPRKLQPHIKHFSDPKHVLKDIELRLTKASFYDFYENYLVHFNDKPGDLEELLSGHKTLFDFELSSPRHPEAVFKVGEPFIPFQITEGAKEIHVHAEHEAPIKRTPCSVTPLAVVSSHTTPTASSAPLPGYD